MWKQTDRSLAAAAFFFAGGLFALLNATVFRIGDATRYDLLLISALSGCGVLGILMAGERFSPSAAGVMMCLPLVTVIPSVLFSVSEIRVLSSGFMFFPYSIFLVWFLPLWFARALAYAWLALFCSLAVARYGSEPLSALLVLVVSGVILGELVGRFKRGIERQAVTDPLCGVWNRRGFEHLLSKSVSAAGRTDRPLALVYLDLDDFKAINDRRGHLAGDQTLRDFARDVERRIRTEDVFGRFGGDEFALLIIDSDAVQARETIERLRLEIPTPAWSYGIAEWQPGERPQDFISRADMRMLDDKQRRKERADALG